jgi:hypothetical protein
VSYDIDLRAPACPTCGHVATAGHLPNPTYNLTPIFDLALTGEPLPNADVGEAAVALFRAKTDRPCGLRILSGRKASDTIPMLKNAVARMQDPAWRSRFLALEPENKWGDLPGAIEVMHDLLRAAEGSPDFIWDVH